jgi:hypothetical protein
MKVFGYKDMVLVEPASLGKGEFRAGLMHRVLFVMEPLTHLNWKFWNDYAGAMKACARLVPHTSEVETAIKGFTNGLELIDAPSACVYVVYSTFDLSTVETNDVRKMINIQMCMTVTTSATDRNFPAVTHMGIFRSPLLSVANLSGLPPLIKAQLEGTPDFYRGKPAKGISLVLHCFAARALVTFLGGRQPALMITAPLPHMGNLLGEVGKIVAIDVTPKLGSSEPPISGGSTSRLSSAPTTGFSSLSSRSPMPMTRPTGTYGRGGMSTSSPKIGAPSLVTKPSLSSQEASSSSSSPMSTSTSTPKIGAPSLVAKPSLSSKEASSSSTSSSSPESARETSPIDAPRQVGALKYAVLRGPMNSSLMIKYQGLDVTWTQIEYPWLFALAFNLSHKYAATFSDLRVLRELHQDIVMASGPHTAQLIKPK